MARYPRSSYAPGSTPAAVIRLPVLWLILHHTVTAQWTGPTAGRNVRQIALSRGFIDISYSQLVDVLGNVIEGRGWGRSGAHTSGYNSSGHGVACVGNFDTHRLPPAMERALVQLAVEHRRYGPGRYTHGHRDLGATACPGRHAYARIAAINRAAAAPPVPAPPQGDDDLTPAQAAMLKEVRDLAKYLHDQLRYSIGEGQTSPAGTVVSNHRHGVETVRKIREVPTGDQLWFRVVNAARFVRDETPGQEVDLDGIAEFVADATAAAVRDELPAVLADLAPEAIAEAVINALPAELASQVIDELAERLTVTT